MKTDEEGRLKALRRYRILDTQPERAFDDLTMLALVRLRHANRAHHAHRRRSAVVQIAHRDLDGGNVEERVILHARHQTAGPLRGSRREQEPDVSRQSLSRDRERHQVLRRSAARHARRLRPRDALRRGQRPADAHARAGRSTRRLATSGPGSTRAARQPGRSRSGARRARPGGGSAGTVDRRAPGVARRRQQAERTSSLLLGVRIQHDHSGRPAGDSEGHRRRHAGARQPPLVGRANHADRAGATGSAGQCHPSRLQGRRLTQGPVHRQLRERRRGADCRSRSRDRLRREDRARPACWRERH